MAKVSKFDYTYKPVGTIATWTQQADSGTATVDTLAYDNADQLTKSTLSGGTTGHNYYTYDPAGNRLVEATATRTTAGQFNTVNQLKGITTSSTTQTIAGHTSAAVSSLSVDAVVVTPGSGISNGTNFTANVQMPNGTNTVSVVATPSSASTPIATQRYQVVASGSAPTALTYDLNGNVLTDENGYHYAWDALNRLTKITYSGGATSNFAYDGLSRRISIIEKNSGGTVTSTKNYLWIGSEIAEERSSGTAVTKRFFPQGEQQTGTNYYYTRDHLGSVRELINSSGTLLSRYSYDPYGRTTLVSGSNLSDFQYAGMYMHQTSGLYLTYFRAFDPNTARWLGRDPLGEGWDATLYSYAGNDPVDDTDPFGLANGTHPKPGGDGGAAAAAADQAFIDSIVNPINNTLTNFENWVDSMEGNSNTAMTAMAASQLGPGRFMSIKEWVSAAKKDALDSCKAKSAGTQTGTHGDALKQAGNQLIQQSNNPNLLPELRAALKAEDNE